MSLPALLPPSLTLVKERVARTLVKDGRETVFQRDLGVALCSGGVGGAQLWERQDRGALWPRSRRAVGGMQPGEGEPGRSQVTWGPGWGTWSDTGVALQQTPEGQGLVGKAPPESDGGSTLVLPPQARAPSRALRGSVRRQPLPGPSSC